MRTVPSFRLEALRLRYARFLADQQLAWPAKVPGRLCVFLAGCMMQSSSTCEHVFEENDVLYEPPGEKPRLRFGASGAGALTFEFDSVPVGVLGPIGFPLDRPFALRSSHCPAVARRILREMNSRDALTPTALEGLTLQLFVEIIRSKRGAFRRAPGWLWGVRERILNSASEPVSMGELAKAAHVHPAHLSQVFRKSYGESVSQLARRVRVEQAAMLLKETKTCLVQIAFESGFCDQSHLCRVFRNATGFTPTEFRRMFRRA